ncbi:MAG: leucine-rich repeat domain-containing protein [Anaerolineae bacterium]|nr:leucine-rich repeat domain-containing protein [Anaerolineae bacterium]
MMSTQSPYLPISSSPYSLHLLVNQAEFRVQYPYPPRRQILLILTPRPLCPSFKSPAEVTMSQTHPHILRRIQEAKDKKLETLDLSYRTTGIKLSQVPPELCELNQLKQLDLRGQAVAVLPEAMLSLQNLTHLDLRGVALASLPNWLKKAKSLNSLGFWWRKPTPPAEWVQKFGCLQLEFYGTYLTSLPNWLIQLNNLISLDLHGNGLTELPNWLAQLTNLTSLSISNNKITSLPDGLAQLINLTALELRATNLITLPDWLVQLTNLTSFSISNNNLTSLPTWMGQFTNLTHLDLSGTNLTGLSDWLIQLTSLTSLDLSYNYITTLPSWLAELHSLTVLDLRGNKLTALPNEFAQLINLTSLHLSYNSLTTLPLWLAELHSLTVLDLRGNKLIKLPNELTQLTNLINLDLSNNKLVVLPSKLGQLTNLTNLDVSRNKLIILPDGLRNLTNLTALDLCRNELIILPNELGQLNSLTALNLSYNSLTALPDGLGQLINLKALYLYENPILTPPLEVLGLDSWGKANVENFRNYFRQLQEAGVENLYEAKLLIIGEAGAGKTTLVNKIINSKYQLDQHLASTEGIDVVKWSFDMTDGQIFRVNIWDFGGQEIYHATHQFFLTKRSLYVLVADMRKEDTDFHYWLNVVSLLSNNSPLLIIKNEKQNRQFEINEPQLRGQFSHFKATLATNLANNRGLAPIVDNIKHYISHLSHVGDALPKTWVNVRQALERDPRPYISLDTYLELCRQHGFKRLEDKLQLSDYLHDLGICLHFQSDPLLKQTVILKPQWGTDAVYRVLDNDQVINNFGRFTLDDLAAIWHEEAYARKRDELLRLMINFQLCYEIPNSRGAYIAPQLLTKIQPTYPWDETDNLILRYTYDFMPKGILLRFFVAMHPFIADQAQVWRSGVVLVKDETQAEVIETYGRREIRIRVAGRHKRDFLTIIAHEMDKIHRSFNRLKYQTLIPCNCDQCRGSQDPHFYDYDRLRTRLANQRYEVECDKSYQMVNVRSLIDDVTGGGYRPDSFGHSSGEDRIRNIKQRRLQHLKEKAAQYGLSVPSEIVMEIDDLEDELK